MKKAADKKANSFLNFNFKKPQPKPKNNPVNEPVVEHFSKPSVEKVEKKSPESAPKSSLIRGFEGLRVLSLLLVLFYHWFPEVVQGGYLGVVAFFTLSGYLTTYSFLKEHHQTGTIHIFSFYKRRFVRLYPSLIFLLFTLSTWVVLFQPNVLTNFRAGFFASLFSYNNWWQISAKLSYFEQYTQINLFTHLWTLAVEVQYYLFWPWVMYFFLNKKELRSAKKPLILFTFGLTLFSILWTFFILAGAEVELNRIYLGTDTRLFSFFLGASFALVMPIARIRALAERISKTFQAQMTAVLLIFILVFSIFLKGGGGFWNYFFMLIWNVMFLMLMFLVVPNQSVNAFIFGSTPMVAIAKRSFAMYLWHYPILMLSNYSLQIFDISASARALFQIFFSILMAEISYQLCERFFVSLWARGSAHMQKYKAGKGAKLPVGVLVKRAVSLVVILVLSCSTVYALVKDNGTLPDDIVELQAQLQKNKELSNDVSSLQVKDLPTSSQTENSESSNESGVDVGLAAVGENTEASSETEAPAIAEDNPLSEENLKKLEAYLPVELSRTQVVEDFESVVQKAPQLILTDLEKRLAPNLSIVLVGDSVLLGAKPELHALLPKATIDADVSRQWAAGAQVIHQLAAENNLPKVIVMALGTNGVISAEQVNQFAETYKDYKIFLVNTVVNNSSEGIANTAIADALARQPNTHLVDWHKLAKTKASWFASDFVHPSSEGRKIYAQLIVKRVLETLIKEAQDEAGLN